MLNANDLQALLANATEETIVQIDYVAGSPKALTAQAVKEFNEAADWNGDRGIPATHYVGTFAGFRTTKKGETILTLFVQNRGTAGQFRTFNPKLGTVLSARIAAE
jgi:hypothetical protein